MHCAHINPETKQEQSVKAHLEGTANRARSFGNSFNNGDYAYICGMLHDKCSFSNSLLKYCSYTPKSIMVFRFISLIIPQKQSYV